VTIAPAKVERVTPNDADVSDFNILRNALSLQYSFSRPFVHALRAGTGAPEVRSAVPALPIIAPDDAHVEIIVVFDFFRLNRRTASFHYESEKGTCV